jgi:hypothetical protein
MENINVSLNKAIEKRELGRIREILSGFITADQSFSKGIFDERLRYCVSRGVLEQELFVPFDGGLLNENPIEWDIPYFAKQRVRFHANFSRERLEHLRQIGKKIFLESDSVPETGEGSTFTEEKTYHPGKGNNAAIGGAIILGGIGAIIGGIVAAAGEAAIFGGVLIGGIAGAVVGACVGVTLDRKKE